MKKLSAIGLSMIMLLALFGSAFASGGPPGSGWWSGITVQNVSGSGSNCVTTPTDPNSQVSIVAFDATTNTQATVSSTCVSDGGSVSFDPTNFTGMGAGFQGGAILSASMDVRAIVNVTNRYLASKGLGDSGTTVYGAGQYQGMQAGDVKLNFPTAKKNYSGKTSTFYVQNAGGAATTALATFNFKIGTVATNFTFTTPSLDPGETAVFTAADARNGANPPPDGVIGGLTVTSNTSAQLTGTVLEHKTAEAHGTLLQATRAMVSADYDNVLYVPTNKNGYVGRFTGINVQNVGGSTINIKATYTVASSNAGCVRGTVVANTQPGIVAGQAATFASSVIPNGCLASAIIQVVDGSGNLAAGSIVGAVNESFTNAFLAANPTRSQESTMYFTFPAHEATNKVSIPIFKEDSANKATGLNVQAISGDANVVMVFKLSNGTTFTTQPILITQGNSQDFLDVRLKPASFWNGTAMNPAALNCTSGNNVCQLGQMSVTITSTGGTIIAIANETTYPITAPRIKQDKNNYEGFNLP